jgi:sec-independent protein translocase protein TatA
MGLSHINILSLVLILVIVLVLFGPNRLRHLGSELGAAIKNFRSGLEEEKEAPPSMQVEKKDEKDQ